ncbi:MAG: hypothetical protein ACK5YR_19870 [Pirellula sp.]|jgi:hypothetical protein
MARAPLFQSHFYWFFVSVLTTLALSSPSFADTALEKEFRAAVRNLPTSFSGQIVASIEGFAAFNVVGTGGAKSQASQRNEFRYEAEIAGSKLRLKELSKSGNSATLRIVNDTYLFGLTEKKGKFSLVTLESLGTEAGQKILEDQKKLSEPLQAIHSGVTLFSMPLRELINNKDFRLISIEKQDQGLVRVDFQFEYNWDGKYPVLVEPSFFVCDPSRSWGIVEFETKTIEGKDKVRHDLRCEIELKVLDDGFPLAVSVVANDADSKGARSTNKWSISVKDSRPDDAIFKLSHYGLPEPNLESSRFWIYVSLVLVCIMCFAFGFVRWRGLTNA